MQIFVNVEVNRISTEMCLKYISSVGTNKYKVLSVSVLIIN